MRSRDHIPQQQQGAFMQGFTFFLFHQTTCAIVSTALNEMLFPRGEVCLRHFGSCWIVVLPFNFCPLIFLCLGLSSETAPSSIISLQRCFLLVQASASQTISATKHFRLLSYIDARNWSCMQVIFENASLPLAKKNQLNLIHGAQFFVA